MASNLALDGPVSINIEDSMDEEVMKNIIEARAFDIVWEIGLKEVLDLQRFGSANVMGEIKKGFDLKS
ncbi:hypothetical protein Pyn_21224 [Prunus yedoensis var. nudiflora]|uniref:Uncharacterized protein n=1 Tax=Prunus yedoensis var. nudiflora TaxID=2094558 RepID=A0A314YB54_PRUYE|nr:hypothetical protein Pyn_21224 [Prunus yedoensis var. nudiflora]